MSFRAPILALTAFSTLVCAMAEELAIPGRYGGKGEPVFEQTKFGKGLRADGLHESAIFPGCGNFRAEQGTVELWLKADEDTRPGSGRSWRPVMTAPPLESQFGARDGQSQFSIGLNADSEKPFTPSAATFSMKTQKTLKTGTESLDWKEGSEHFLAATWGERGMELFIDGKLAAKGPKAKGPYLDAPPSCLIFGRHVEYPQLSAKMTIDEIKISDVQRDAAYLEKAFSSGRAPEMDANTLLLSHLDGSVDATGANTEWRKAQSLTTLRTDWQCQLDRTDSEGNVFLTGELPKLHAFASRLAAQDGEFSVECSVLDFNGKEAFSTSRKVSLPARCDFFDVEIPLTAGLLPGYYSAKLKLKDSSSALVAESNQRLCVLDGAFRQGRFLWGFNETEDYDFAFPALKKMGVGALRGHGVYFWTYAEPKKGDFRFAVQKAFSENCERYGIRVLGILGNVPLWAGTPPDNLKDFEGGKSYEKALMWKERYRPRSVEEWSEYVAKTAAANPQVKDWEIWNEPDWHLPQTQGFGFGGTTAQYFELLKAANAAIRKSAPESRVVFGGIACAAIADQNFSADLLKMGALKYLDLLGMHSYGGNQFFREQLELFRKAGYKGPVWQSEFVPDCFPSVPYPQIQKDLAWQQPQHIVGMLPLGISAYIIHDVSINFPYGQPGEAVFADALLFRKLDGLDFIGSPTPNAFLFGNESRALLALWGKDSVALRSNAAKLLLTDYMGFEKELETKDGAANIAPGKFLYVEAAKGERLDPASVRVEQPLPDALPLNGSFEDYEGDGGFGSFTPKNWELSPFHRDGRMRVDTEIKKDGKASLLFERSASDGEGKKAAVYQKLPASCRGKSFSLRAWVKFEPQSGAKSSVALTVWDRDRQKLYGGIFISEPKNDFAPYSKTVTIPADASDSITLGISLEGGAAKAWIDGVELKASPR